MTIIAENKGIRADTIEDVNGDVRLDFSGADTVVLAENFLDDIIVNIDGVERLRYAGLPDDTLSAFKNLTGEAAINIDFNFVQIITNGGTDLHTIIGFRPAGALILGVTLDILSPLIGAGLTSFSLGDAVDPNLYGGGIALAAGTTVGMSDYTANPFEFLTADADVRLQANGGGVFSSGVALVAVHFIDLTQLT
jgi:hypothetical protein